MKIKPVLLFFSILIIFSCNNDDNLSGYWREYNDMYPDCYNTMHISDTIIVYNSMYLNWIRDLKYENNKLVLPFDEFNEFSTEYKLKEDTIFYKGNKVWVKYNYSVMNFIEDISNGYSMVKILPDFTELNENYLDFEIHSAVLINIGNVKKCYREKALKYNSYNYNGYYIHTNDVFGDIKDIISWTNNYNTVELIINADRDVSEEFSKMIINEFHKSQKYMRFYRTYADTINKKLKIKRINTNQIFNQ